ncbi:UDP-glycosyltransferase 89B2 [Silene latifolia]|uniref:UDP-glycosyltransferase 89B2 n=1 Tax=Silene latifolia TaxID=37657 RepID=UPI003D7708F4
MANPTHILIIPYPAQGHMIPLLDLTHHLATTRTTTPLTITILTTPKNLPILSPLLSSTTNVTPLILPFPPTPGFPPGAENTKDLPPASFRQLIPALSRLEEPLGHWFESHPSPPVVIISDFFVGWTQRFAAKMGIKRVVFSPSGGMALSVIYALWRDMPKEEDQDQNGDVLFKGLPNCPKYPWWQLSPIFRSYVEGDYNSEVIKDGFRNDMDSWGLVINTFDDLERVYLDHLISVLGHNRVWAVGPLFPPHGLKDRGGSSTVDPDTILSWLDSCRDNEVVYVSFGTQSLLTTRQIEVLAEALENSRVRFIWSVRDPSVTNELDKEGDRKIHNTVFKEFEDRVGDRGMIIKGWAPQVSILRHRAVGTFLTHCGWNSVLEGLMAGVGMLAWPMGADQYTNATLLVDELKVGVRICEGPQFVPDPCVLAQTLADSVNGEILDRQRIGKLHTSCLDAVSENGSSSKELVKFVKMLTELKTKNT